ncbi:glycoside hydrolase family 13 protein [Scrofimicrobium sp. R131]|uniref:Glycoside hydrolase family 13 protein n=1 Tax=Scrofimicrobium appendicitidis TaxID=3079930 RepID=A0AAU7V7B1_9ACTO
METSAALHPVEGPNSAADWWQGGVFYQVYPRSFADSNRDGIGDLHGVLGRLDYLQQLGVDALWLSPFYPSPQHDTGYDVSDYFGVNPEYGTIEDFVQVVDAAHDRGLRILIDLVPNHSSSEHPLFQAALASGVGSPERDRYFFRYGGDNPPNNWGSQFGGPAWSQVQPLSGKEEDRGWWYLHLFDASQPDLNWDNPDVRHLFDEVLRFWLDLGADGFRVDVAHGLVKKPGLPDDQIGLNRLEIAPEELGRLYDQAPYFDQDDVHNIYRRWRRILDDYGPDRIMIGEVGVQDPNRKALYIRPGEMNQAFSFRVMHIGWDAPRLREALQTANGLELKFGGINTWVLSNHDVVRHATRLCYPRGSIFEGGLGPSDPRPDREMGLRRGLAYTVFLLGVPGSCYLYNGEELGLPEVLEIPDQARTDPTWERTGHRSYGRDGARVPLPWTADPVADWGPNPWLPIPDGWGELSAERQEGDPNSVLNQYRHFLQVRRQYGLGQGEWEVLDVDPDLVVVRAGHYLSVLNLGIGERKLPFTGQVILATEPPRQEDGHYWLAPNSAAWVQL